jgi:hypothetical protein
MSSHDNWARCHVDVCSECREALEQPSTEAMAEAVLRAGGCMREVRRERERDPADVACADAAVMQILSGARFAPGTGVILPSGQRVDGSEIGEVLHEEEK